MSESNIITGQYVQISQTPASVGERIFARLIDVVVLFIYAYAAFYFVEFIDKNVYDFDTWLIPVLSYFPFFFYSAICETLTHGQTVGKFLLHTRVVMVDGSAPTFGAILLRWILLPFDLWLTTGMGTIAVILTKNNQRLGDLAAGTMVIKTDNINQIHVSLDEFYSVSRHYRPTYPEAAELSQGQINVIEQVMADSANYDENRVRQLSQKVQEALGIRPKKGSDANFLITLLYDYRFYATQII